LHREAERTQLVRDPLGHCLLLAGETRDRPGVTRPGDEEALVAAAPPRTWGRTRAPKSRIWSCRRSPQSSSMTWVQPASLYSSIAAMESSGVPAIGLHLSSSASVTSSLAARRPPPSLSTA